MKRKLLRILPFLLLGGVLGLAAAPAAFEAAGVKAENSNIITCSNFKDGGTSGSGSSVSYSYSPITISSDGGYSTSGILRVYKGKKLTIESSTYEISKIDFEFSSTYTGDLDSSITLETPKASWSKTLSSQARFKSITVTLSTADVVLSSLSVDTSNAKTSFVKGQTLDLTGLKVDGNKVGGGTVNVTSQCSFSPAAGTKLDTVGSTTVNITYAGTNTPATETGEDLTASYNVTVTEGEKENVYTKADSIADGDKIIIVNSGESRAATVISDSCLATNEITVADDTAKFKDSDGITVFTVVENDDNTYSFKNSANKYLGVTGAKDDPKVVTFGSDISSKTSWTMVGTSLMNCCSDSSSHTKKYLQYNASTNDFRMYGKNMADIEFFKYTSGAEKILVQSTASVLEEASLTISCTAQGFTPSSYLWSVSDAETLQIVGDSNKSSVTVKGLKPGSANLTIKANDNDDLTATCVVTVIAKKDAIIENGNYFITDFSGGHVLNTDLSDIQSPDYTDITKMWTIQNNGIDGDTYTISNGSNYLHHNTSKTGSKLEISSDSSRYWTVSKNADDSYTFADSESQYMLSCNPGASTGTWWAYNNPTGTQNHIKLLKAGTYSTYEVARRYEAKNYFVGDTFNPLNWQINAIFDNGAKVDITNLIVWDTIQEGTVVTGKVNIGGEDRSIELPNIKIFKADVSTLSIVGLSDKYQKGEHINKDNLSVTLTYKCAGQTDIVKNLSKTDYEFEPAVIAADTEKITFKLVKDPTVTKDFDIEVIDSNLVVANNVHDGDIISFGTLGYDPYQINGGYELAHDGTKFTYETFGLMPNGAMRFAVEKNGSYYNLKDIETEKYLIGDASAFKFLEPDYKNVTDNNGYYSFNLNVNIAGQTRLLTLKSDQNPADFSAYGTFHSFDYVGDDYLSYIQGNSDLANNKLIFEYYDFNISYDPVQVVEINVYDWKFENKIFYYALEAPTELPEEAYFTISYDDLADYWTVSSKAHADKELCYNLDGKFGFYSIGTGYSKGYLPAVVFRDNTRPLHSALTSLSVSFTPIEGTEPQEYMNTVTVGEQFPWTSALIVTANYEGGAHKRVPVGGYEIVTMPDTSVIGSSKGKISYGVDGNKLEKEFTIQVVGKTQAFDVVCPDPIRVGETLQATLKSGQGKYTPPEGEPVTWSVSDPILASIDQDGNVTGLKAGYVDVIATSFDGSYSDFEHVRIFQNVTDLSLNKTNITIEAGKTETITATVLPADASNPGVTWDSSNKNVATVNSQGVVTGLSEGTTTITCTTQGKPFGADEPLTATCTVKVEGGTAVRVKGVSLNCEYKEVKRGDTFQLEAIINPSDATDKNVTWTTNNSDLASVSKNGLVQIKASASIGKTARITVKTNDGGYTAYCDFKITSGGSDPVHVTSVTLNASTKSIDVNETFTLNATVKPDNADTKTVTWTSSDESIAEIVSYTSSSAVIKGISDGTAVITAKCDGKSATCTVKVGSEPEPIKVESVSIKYDAKDATELEFDINDTPTLVAVINPSNAANKKVTWSSSDTSVAKVSSNGKLNFLGLGIVEITVKTADGNKTDKVTIKVVDKAAQNNQTIIIIAAAGGGTVVVGAGCGVGIPLAIKAKKRKLLK